MIGGIGFVLLSGAVFWWQFQGLDDGGVAPRWERLQWSYLALAPLCLPIETLACALRIWVIARVLEPGVRLGTASGPSGPRWRSPP